MPRVRGVALLLAVVSLAAAGSADAQQFGRNKVEYVDFDFRVLETEHFSVYFYPSEEKAAAIAARLAERWYSRLSRALDHQLSARQPLILYASHPEFAQTNVVGGFLGEGIGGVTESSRRRIVMPFAPTLAETDHVIGHELVHAFQFDMTKKNGGALVWPLWSIEGMAEYLSMGQDDGETRMWLQDAVQSELIPEREYEAAREFSPYRYGAAIWAYLAQRFGDGVVRDVLKAGKAGRFDRRVLAVTGITLDQLFADWRSAVHERFAVNDATPKPRGGTTLLRTKKKGRMHLGPALSPNGHQAIFFSERDRLSLDLFLVDVTSGSVVRKLATTSGTRQYESLQAIRSSGSWSPDGSRFAFAAIERGQPTLRILDISGSGRERKIPLPSLGQVLTPSWSPDSRRIAFAGLTGGVTDLFFYDLKANRLTQLTDDVYSDLQPVWAPDGLSLAFVTDRFTSDIAALRFGVLELAAFDLQSRRTRRLVGPTGARQTNPQWSGRGDSLFFVSDPSGVSNVFRFDLASGVVSQVTEVSGGVTGLTATSPALSVARDAPVIAFTSYRRGAYHVQVARGMATEGHEVAKVADPAPPVSADGTLARLLDDAVTGVPDPESLSLREYAPQLSLEAIGQPYLSSGGGPFGGFVRGGGSLLFGDLLGERRLGATVQIGNRMRDLALGVGYFNREHRWNWGTSADLIPSIRRLPRRALVDHDGESAVSRQTHYFERLQWRLDGVVAYPFNQGQRIEIDGGVRHITYKQTIQETVRSLDTAKVLVKSLASRPGGAPATFGETSAAFVGDTAVHGPTSPILGSRYRFELSSAFGDLSFSRLLLDYRRYVMPVKPFTVAGRLVHLGHYGPDADDPRILPAFLGSRQFVHGYGWSSLQCGPVAEGNCDAWEDLLGSRLLVGNLEVRGPLLGLFSRDIQYGPVPAEAFVFADGGLVWSRSAVFAASARERQLVTSGGAGIRLNAFGFPLEFAAVRAFDAPARGWSFAFNFQPGF